MSLTRIVTLCSAHKVRTRGIGRSAVEVFVQRNKDLFVLVRHIGLSNALLLVTIRNILSHHYAWVRSYRRISRRLYGVGFSSCNVIAFSIRVDAVSIECIDGAS